MPSNILSDNGVSSGSAGLKTTAASDGVLALQTTTAGGSATTALTIDTSQRVGIGTTSPSYPLDVRSANPSLNVQATTGTNQTSLLLQNTGGSFYFGIDNSAGTSYGTGTAYARALWSDGAYPITFTTNSSERMRIDSSGNVGIGVTPASWASTYRALQIRNLGIMTINDSNWLYSNTYYNGTNNVYTSTGYAGAFDFNGVVTGGYSWRVAASGTAGNTISYTQAMVIDNSGNVGIGTTSPTNRLTVNGGTGSTPTIRLNGGTAADDNALISSKYNLVLGCNADGNISSRAITFVNSTTENMRIDSSGSVGIGNTSPGSAATRLAIKGSGSSTNTLSVFRNSADTTILSLREDGFVYLPTSYNNTTVNGANFFINPDGGLYRSTSSIKYKKNVQDSTHGLADLMKLRSVTYEGKTQEDAGKVIGGLIAEEVHDAGLTEFVEFAPDGSPDALAYGNMVSLCVKAIQELKAINDTQAETINALTARVVALEGK